MVGPLALLLIIEARPQGSFARCLLLQLLLAIPSVANCGYSATSADVKLAAVSCTRTFHMRLKKAFSGFHVLRVSAYRATSTQPTIPQRSLSVIAACGDHQCLTLYVAKLWPSRPRSACKQTAAMLGSHCSGATSVVATVPSANIQWILRNGDTSCLTCVSRLARFQGIGD